MNAFRIVVETRTGIVARQLVDLLAQIRAESIQGRRALLGPRPPLRLRELGLPVRHHRDDALAFEDCRLDVVPVGAGPRLGNFDERTSEERRCEQSEDLLRRAGGPTVGCARLASDFDFPDTLAVFHPSAQHDPRTREVPVFGVVVGRCEDARTVGGVSDRHSRVIVAPVGWPRRKIAAEHSPVRHIAAHKPASIRLPPVHP